MTEFLLAAAAFLLAHVVPAATDLRARLIARFGRSTYLGAYSALSVVLLGWLIVAARRADTIPLWNPATWHWYVPLLLMPVAGFLLVAGLLSPNPLSISLRPGARAGAIAAVTRHPILCAFLIWALAHIPPNGDLVALILFGAMAAFSVLGFAILDARARRRLGREEWQVQARRSSLLPFAALALGRVSLGSLRPLAGPAIISVILYLWFTLQGHELLIGPDPLAPLAG